MPKIGVVLNNKNQITSLMEGTLIGIYEKRETVWIQTEEIRDCFMQRDSIYQMREFLKELVAQLKDCKILAASILTGVPFMVLDKEGFMLCETTELSDQLFEQIAYDYAKAEQTRLEASAKELLQNGTVNYPVQPFETDVKGIFELDMNKLQKFHPEISSKKAMIPFLKKKEFQKLLIYCSHVMPWLDRELPALELSYKTDTLEGSRYQIAIYNETDS